MTGWKKGVPSEGCVFTLILLEGDTVPHVGQFEPNHNCWSYFANGNLYKADPDLVEYHPLPPHERFDEKTHLVTKEGVDFRKEYLLCLKDRDATYIQLDKAQLRIGELEQIVASLQKTVIENGEHLLDPDKVPSPEEQRHIVERAREEREKMKGKEKDV